MFRSPPLVAAVILAVGSISAAAGRGPLPTLSVLRIEGDGATRVARGDGDALADELARQFAASGRFRVLEPAWLTETSTDGTAVDVARARRAAAAADVAFLVTGVISKPRGSRSPLWLDLQVSDVATGAVVRTTRGATRAGPPRPRVPGPPGPAFAAVTRQRRSSDLTDRFHDVIADLAAALTLSAPQWVHRR